MATASLPVRRRGLTVSRAREPTMKGFPRKVLCLAWECGTELLVGERAVIGGVHDGAVAVGHHHHFVALVVAVQAGRASAA